MTYAIVFTGHRDVAHGHDLLIRNNISHHSNASMIFIGGARGADTIAMREAHRCAIPITVVVAATLNDQPGSFIDEFNKLPIRPRLIEMGLPYNADSLKKRNHLMVDTAILEYGLDVQVLAYWDGRFRSGTYSAMCYAKRKSIQVRYIKL